MDEVLGEHADLETVHHTPPEGGGNGTDQTARDAAAANTEAATAHADDANAHHTPLRAVRAAETIHLGTEGNDLLLVPTDKVNLSGVQNQIDEILRSPTQWNDQCRCGCPGRWLKLAEVHRPDGLYGLCTGQGSRPGASNNDLTEANEARYPKRS